MSLKSQMQQYIIQQGRDKVVKILVLGMGNPILRDDGIGPRIVDELRKYIHNPDVILQQTSLSGINMMELLVGFDYAIIVDAIQTGEKPGKIHLLALRDLSFQHHYSSSQHHISLFQALELGKSLALSLPGEVTILAVEAEDVTSFGEGLTSNVEKAVPAALRMIEREINKRKQGGKSVNCHEHCFRNLI